MGADGSNPINLTNNPAHDEYPAWSPDGSKIAFYSDREAPGQGNSEIYVMDSKTGDNVVRLGKKGIEPAWSPDGTKIVFGSGGIIVMEVEEPANQVNLTEGKPGSNCCPDWQPLPGVGGIAELPSLVTGRNAHRIL